MAPLQALNHYQSELAAAVQALLAGTGDGSEIQNLYNSAISAASTAYGGSASYYGIVEQLAASMEQAINHVGGLENQTDPGQWVETTAQNTGSLVAIGQTGNEYSASTIAELEKLRDAAEADRKVLADLQAEKLAEAEAYQDAILDNSITQTGLLSDMLDTMRNPRERLDPSGGVNDRIGGGRTVGYDPISVDDRTPGEVEIADELEEQTTELGTISAALDGMPAQLTVIGDHLVGLRDDTGLVTDAVTDHSGVMDAQLAGLIESTMASADLLSTTIRQETTRVIGGLDRVEIAVDRVTEKMGDLQTEIRNLKGENGDDLPKGQPR